MTENSSNHALANALAHNQMAVVADIDHRSEQIPAIIANQLPAAVKEGAHFLFIEVDPKGSSVEDVISRGDAFAGMVKQAQSLGMEVVLVDDRSRQRERNARYPEEVAFMKAYDPYGMDVDALIAAAPNPERMAAYIDERMQGKHGDIAFRNEAMATAIAQRMGPDEQRRGIFVVGAAHLSAANDIDEQLRANGITTTTIQINAADAEILPELARAADKPDVIIDGNTGQIISTKNPETGTVHAVPADGQVNWRNQEPVADRNHPQMQCALDAAGGVNCSWNQGLNNSLVPYVSPAKTGQMASPSTERRAAGAEVGSPPR